MRKVTDKTTLKIIAAIFCFTLLAEVYSAATRELTPWQYADIVADTVLAGAVVAVLYDKLKEFWLEAAWLLWAIVGFVIGFATDNVLTMALMAVLVVLTSFSMGQMSNKKN